jgi:hypothetical protein
MISQNGHQDQEGIIRLRNDNVVDFVSDGCTNNNNSLSLQQEEDNDNETETSSAVANATTDEPFIPIGPAEEDSPKVTQLQYLSSFFFTFQV